MGFRREGIQIYKSEAVGVGIGDLGIAWLAVCVTSQSGTLHSCILFPHARGWLQSREHGAQRRDSARRSERSRRRVHRQSGSRGRNWRGRWWAARLHWRSAPCARKWPWQHSSRHSIHNANWAPVGRPGRRGWSKWRLSIANKWRVGSRHWWWHTADRGRPLTRAAGLTGTHAFLLVCGRPLQCCAARLLEHCGRLLQGLLFHRCGWFLLDCSRLLRRLLLLRCHRLGVLKRRRLLPHGV